MISDEHNNVDRTNVRVSAVFWPSILPGRTVSGFLRAALFFAGAVLPFFFCWERAIFSSAVTLFYGAACRRRGRGSCHRRSPLCGGVVRPRRLVFLYEKAAGTREALLDML